MRGLTVALLLAVTTTLHADVLDDLLRFPGPPPGEWATPRPASSKEPAADAPLPELAQWWSNPSLHDSQPPAATRERLIDVIEQEPNLLPLLIDLLPARQDVCERVERAPDTDRVATWLLHHCASRRDALVAAARKTADSEQYPGSIDYAEELEALAQADWERAEPVLRQLAGSPQSRPRTLAQALLYEHTNDDALRATLQATAADRTMPAAARDRAFDALARTEWEGRDAWIVAQMADPTILNPVDDSMLYASVNDVVRRDPAKWIPVMVELLASSDRTIRSQAANALAQFHLRDARADALRPLIPWISDPELAQDTSMHRLRLIQSVADLGLREAIPHLVQAVKSDPDGTNRGYAAEALVRFGDRSGIDAMRAALATDIAGMDRQLLIEALLASDGIPAAELAQGAEAFLGSTQSPIEVSLGTAPVPPAVSVGLVVANKFPGRDDVATLLITRAGELAKTKPELARKLIALVESWDVPAAHALRLQRIEQGTADAQTIAMALDKRESLRASSPDVLRRLRDAGGIRGGIAAVILGDPMDEQRILAGKDVEMQRALLHSARIVREPLPVDAVAALFGRTPALDVAAEEFLIGDDSAAARALVQKRHPNELLILGSTLSWDPGHSTHSTFSEWEKTLVKQFRASRDDEWIVIASGGYWSALGVETEVRIRDGKATMKFAAEDGSRSVPLSRASVGRLRLFLERTRFDDLGPIDTGAFDGIQYQYVHLTRTSGRRVYMNNPQLSSSPHEELLRFLPTLAADAVR